MTIDHEQRRGRRIDTLHRRALRAAAGAALLGGGLACGPAPGVAPLGGPAPGAADAGGAAALADLGASAPDAGAPDLAGLGSDAGSGELDAGMCEQGPGWAECCDAVGWDPNRGCLAWGPPAPPPMSEVA